MEQLINLITQWATIIWTNQTAAQWFTAIGTNLAVIIAIWLAYRDRKIKLKISTEYCWTSEPGNEGTYLIIKIANIGYREVEITKIGLKQYFSENIIFDPDDPGYQDIVNKPIGKLPKRLNNSNIEKYSISVYDIPHQLLSSKLQFTQIQVFTSIGKTIKTRINRKTRKELIKIISLNRPGFARDSNS